MLTPMRFPKQPTKIRPIAGELLQGISAGLTQWFMGHRRIKFFTGAPECGELDWSEEALDSQLLPAFLDSQLLTATLAPGEGGKHQDVNNSVTSTIPAKWRHISLDGATFYQTPTKPTASPVLPLSTLASDDFLDHSLALLDDLQSSQLAAHESTLEDETSFQTSFASSDSLPVHTPLRLHVPGPITSLSSLPSAAHLTRIRPQTVTVNLIAAVISIAEERTVTLRNGRGTIGIVEAVLGDDTRAGFNLTIWLGTGSELGDTVRGLRRGDIVCVERVALAVYAGVVFGQTLNRKVAGVVTRLTKVEGLIESTSEAVVGKIQRVREWAGEYVGPERAVVKGRMASSRESWLPDDSQ